MTNKDIEEAFSALFGHLYENDQEQLLADAKWVAQGYAYIPAHRLEQMRGPWDKLVAERYLYNMGHGKTCPELDKRLLWHMKLTAFMGYTHHRFYGQERAANDD